MVLEFASIPSPAVSGVSAAVPILRPQEVHQNATGLHYYQNALGTMFFGIGVPTQIRFISGHLPPVYFQFMKGS